MNSPDTIDKPNTGKPPRKGYKRRYTPPCEIRDIPGVRKTQDLHEDRYNGTKDDLVAMGLLPPELFPGEPDMPAGGVTLWPPEAKHGGGWFYPGRMQVTRTAAGTFTIRLAVSAEEQARRKQDEETRHAHRRQEEHVHWDSEEQVKGRLQEVEMTQAAIDNLRERIECARACLALSDAQLVAQHRSELRDDIERWDVMLHDYTVKLRAMGLRKESSSPRLRLVHSDRRIAS